MNIDLCSTHDYIFIIVTLCCAVLELYLGKTTKIKSGSILELIYNLIVAILRLKK